MAKQNFNIGTAPNDNTGDTDRVAWVKAQANFDELYDSGNLTTTAVFKKPNGDFINTESSPITGVIPIDLTDAVNGGFCGVYYQGALLNAITSFSGATKVFVSGINIVDELCIVWLVYHKSVDLIIATIQTGVLLTAASVEAVGVLTITEAAIEAVGVLTITD